MPRFQIKTLLIAFAIVALWLSSFSGFAAADDVRRSLLLAVLAVAGYAAAYCRGRRRAFWAGFFFTMLAHGFSLAATFDSTSVQHKFGYISTLNFTGSFTNRVIPFLAAQGSPAYHETYRAIEATFAAVWVLTISTVIGLIGLSMYDYGHEREK
jgi:hypothetical protein